MTVEKATFCLFVTSIVGWLCCIGMSILAVMWRRVAKMAQKNCDDSLEGWERALETCEKWKETCKGLTTTCVRYQKLLEEQLKK